jgi:hypothetical protein
MLNLRRRVKILEERMLLANAPLAFDWEQLGDIPDTVLQSFSLETLDLLASAIKADDQKRSLTIPERKACADLFALAVGKAGKNAHRIFAGG